MIRYGVTLRYPCGVALTLLPLLMLSPPYSTIVVRRAASHDCRGVPREALTLILRPGATLRATQHERRVTRWREVGRDGRSIRCGCAGTLAISTGSRASGARFRRFPGTRARRRGERGHRPSRRLPAVAR